MSRVTDEADALVEHKDDGKDLDKNENEVQKIIDEIDQKIKDCDPEEIEKG